MDVSRVVPAVADGAKCFASFTDARCFPIMPKGCPLNRSETSGRKSAELRCSHPRLTLKLSCFTPTDAAHVGVRCRPAWRGTDGPPAQHASATVAAFLTRGDGTLARTVLAAFFDANDRPRLVIKTCLEPTAGEWCRSPHYPAIARLLNGCGTAACRCGWRGWRRCRRGAPTCDAD